MRSIRNFAAATACKPHARALHARAGLLARARGVRERAIREPLRRRLVDSIGLSRNVCRTLHHDAIESTSRLRNASRTANSG
eukprot:5844716-Lingulodinium_polyedra.AAC.1